MPIATSEVFSAYRHLIRSIAIAFHGGHATLSSARQEARRWFKEQQHLNPESAAALEALTAAQSVGRFLRQNLVQGVKAEGEERYRLRIHDEIERGDNSTIKKPTPIPMPERKIRRTKTDLS